MSEICIQKINYKGWDDAVQMTNGVVDVVIVPAIGRIMAYGFCGERNMLWHDPDLEGVVVQEDIFDQNELEWMNFGGDKVWPTEQRLFPVLNGFAWPPDPYLDAFSHHLKILNDGFEMISPVSPFCGAQVVRRIGMHPGQSRITIEQELTKVQPAQKSNDEPIPLTIWNITQIPVPELVVFPIASDSRHEKGMMVWDIDDRIHQNLSVDGTIGNFKPSKDFDQKIGTDAENWLAALNGDIVFVESFTKERGGVYPDNHCTTEVYSCPRYVELELLSPLKNLEPGESTSYTISWDLKKVSGSLENRKKALLSWLGE